MVSARETLRLIGGDNCCDHRPMDLIRIRKQPLRVSTPAPRVAAASDMRVGPLLAIVPRLRAMGIDPVQAFAQAGLGAEIPSDPERRVPYLEASALFAACARLTGQPQFALEAGASLGLATLGLPGDIARHSPTVGDALRALTDHFDLHDRGGGVVFHVRDGVATLAYAVHEPGAQAIDHAADFAIAIAAGVMRDLCGADWRPSLVRFAHRPPADAMLYARVFGSRVEFDAPEDSLLFASSWLAMPVAEADPRRLDDLARRAAEMELDDPRSWVQRLRPTLRAGLAIRECSIAQVSVVMGVHRRTLERRLNAEGATFKDVLDGVRHEMAVQLLANTTLPMTEIADALGFADPAVFSRAFRRWRGTAPSDWRRRGGPGA
jgi:AraC-like DNA-binding protein